MNPALLQLGFVFGQLGLIAVGGGITVLAEMQRQVVSVHHWMSGTAFASLFALAQASPGPNLLVVTLVGWHVAGLAGALVATLAMFGPPAVLAYGVAHVWQRWRDRPWRAQVQAGVTPVVAGLLMAASVMLSLSTSTSPVAALVTLGTAVVLGTTRLNPLWLLAAAAGLGLLGVV